MGDAESRVRLTALGIEHSKLYCGQVGIVFCAFFFLENFFKGW